MKVHNTSDLSQLIPHCSNRQLLMNLVGKEEK